MNRPISPAFCIVLLFSNLLSSQTYDTWNVPQTRDFTVSGEGNHESWNKTDWLELPQRRMSSKPMSTRVKTLYSDKGIYFLFDCKDEKVSSTMDEDFLHLWEEDVVEVFLWTDEDHPIYFEYEISPMNYELPILVPNMDGEFLGWLPWDYEGERKIIHETSVKGGEKKNGSVITSWMAEFFIPYALLRPLQNVPPKTGTQWRCNMYRVDHDDAPPSSTWSWQPVEKGFHDFKLFGVLKFE